MSHTALLCLALFVGTASAWGNWGHWFSKNRRTECGKFKTLRDGWWFIDNSVTDVDTQKILDDTKEMDVDKDGYLSFAEAYNESAFLAGDPPMSLDNGFSRCTHVMLEVKRYGFNKEVSSHIFDLFDTNDDLVANRADITPQMHLLNDADGDGRVSVCETFHGYLKAVQIAENKVYLRNLKYENLVWKHRKHSYWNFWKW